MRARGHHAVHVHLRRAGLAADSIALDVGVVAAALLDHLLKQRAHGLRGFLANGMRPDLGRVLEQHLAALRHDAFDHVGPHQASAVDHRAGGGKQLDGRDRNRLAEAHPRQVNPLEPLPRDQYAARLAGDVDARGLAQAERLQVIVQPVGAQPQPQLDEHGVAGVAQRLGHTLRAVRAPPAVDGAAVHRDPARAVKPLARIGHPAVERRRRGQDLEGGAGLVRVGDAAVAHQVGQRVHVASGRVVGVVVRLGTHGQYLAGLRVHDQHPHALCAVDLHRLARGLLREALNHVVDGQLSLRPGHRRHVLAGAVGQRASLAVDFVQHKARLAGQVLVERGLQAALPHAVDGRQAQQLLGKLPHRVVSLGFLLQIQAGKRLGRGRLVLGEQRLELLGDFARNLPFEHHAALAPVRNLLQDLFLGHLEHGRQDARKRLRLFHLAGAGRSGVGGGADGQQVAVPVDDRAAAGADDRFARPLCLGAGLKLARAHDLQVKQPRNQRGKQQGEHAHAQRRPLSYQMTRG